MALITGFEHDIFISYASKDNTTVSETDGWVKRFYIDLKDKLIRSTGQSDINIWWDSKKLDGNTYFDQTIKKGLDKSAILICLHSPSYMASKWCIKELKHFSEKIQSDGYGNMIGDEARVIHVMLYNLPRSEWPEEFLGRTGMRFYDAEDDLQGDPKSTNSEEFQESMKGLRDALLRLIAGFKSHERTQVPEKSKAPKKDQVTIFFGNPPESLGDRPKRIISELAEKGFNIISDIPLNDPKIHQKQVAEALTDAKLTIHFLDQYPGRSIDGEANNWYRKKEIEMALQSNASQLIWTSADFEFSSIEEEAYKSFLIDLEEGKLGDKGYEFVRSVKGNIIKEVIGHADQLKVVQKEVSASGGVCKILLDNHSNDRDYALELHNGLSEHEISTFLTPMEDDPKNNNEKLRNYISKSQKFVFLYGKVEEEWLNARLTTALKILLDYGHSAKDMIVYMTPPKKGMNTVKIKEQGIPIQIINNSEELDLKEQMIKQLAEDLKATGDGK